MAVHLHSGLLTGKLEGSTAPACAAALALLVFAAGSCPAAQAKLGEDFAQYKARTAKGLVFNGESKKGDATNYMFELARDEKQQMASPGYAAGVTITAV